MISPLIANLFLHYAFGEWMKRNYPQNPFERYADDGVVHCKTETEASNLRKAIEERLAECKLELHPDKTKIQGTGNQNKFFSTFSLYTGLQAAACCLVATPFFSVFSF